MNKIILPIDVEIWYINEKDKTEKIEVIKNLLIEITRSKDKINDIKKLNKYLSIIKWEKQSKWFYVLQLWISFLFIIIISIMILGIRFYNWELVSTNYLWRNSAYWYYLQWNGWDETLKYWKININWCNDDACNTDKWVVIRRYIDYYTFF